MSTQTIQSQTVFDPAQISYPNLEAQKRYSGKNEAIASELNQGGPFIVVFSQPVYEDKLEDTDLHYALIVTRKGILPFPLLEVCTGLYFQHPANLDDFTCWMQDHFGAQYVWHLQAWSGDQVDLREITAIASRYLRMSGQRAYETRLTIEAELYTLDERYREKTEIGKALHRELVVARNLEARSDRIPAAVVRFWVNSRHLRRALREMGISKSEAFQLTRITFRQKEFTVIRAKDYTRSDDLGLHETMLVLAQLLEGLYAVAYEDNGRWDISQHTRWADAMLVYANVRGHCEEACLVPITEVDRLRDQDFSLVKPRVVFCENRDTQAYPGSKWKKANHISQPGLQGWRLVMDHWTNPQTGELMTVYRHPII